jgi:hypothetical protein
MLRRETAGSNAEPTHPCNRDSPCPSNLQIKHPTQDGTIPQPVKFGINLACPNFFPIYSVPPKMRRTGSGEGKGENEKEREKTGLLDQGKTRTAFQTVVHHPFCPCWEETAWIIPQELQAPEHCSAFKMPSARRHPQTSIPAVAYRWS